MGINKNNNSIVPINWIDETEKFIVVPRIEKGRIVKKVKPLRKVKGNCYFTRGVSYDLIDFIYRAVRMLNLHDRKLIISRGSVKKNGKNVYNAVAVYELEWDLGTSIIIPQRLKHDKMVTVEVEGIDYPARLMELITLTALLHLACTGKTNSWYNSYSAKILVHGWKSFTEET